MTRTTLLAHIEHAGARRRRLNRALVCPGRDPDTGAPLPPAPSGLPKRHAEAQAAAAVRAWMTLPEERELERAGLAGKGVDSTEGVVDATLARALDLITRGASKDQTAEIIGVSAGCVDSLLRRGYALLGARCVVQAAAAWRARCRANGHRMQAGDQAALDALYPPAHRAVHPLTPRQHEMLRLASEGVSRRELPDALGVHTGTVGVQLHDAYGRLGAHDLPSAVTIWLRRQGKAA